MISQNLDLHIANFPSSVKPALIQIGDIISSVSDKSEFYETGRLSEGNAIEGGIVFQKGAASFFTLPSEETEVFAISSRFFSQIYVKVQPTQMEWQYWKLTFKPTNAAPIQDKTSTLNPQIREANITGTGESDRLYRRKATYCEIYIKDQDSSNQLGYEKIDIKDSKFNFTIDIGVFLKSHVAISVKFSWEDVAKAPKPLSLDSILKTMFDESSVTDFVIKTADKEFPCHKVVLAARSRYFKTMFEARSQYFKTMFEDRIKDSVENMIYWEDVADAATVQDLLDFMYTSSKPTNISQTCFSLVNVAHLCLMEDLKEMCFEEIVPLTSIDNVVKILVMGDKFQSDQLLEAAMTFIAEKYEKCEGNFPGWEEIEGPLAKKLMSALLKLIGVKKI